MTPFSPIYPPTFEIYFYSQITISYKFFIVFKKSSLANDNYTYLQYSRNVML